MISIIAAAGTEAASQRLPRDFWCKLAVLHRSARELYHRAFCVEKVRLAPIQEMLEQRRKRIAEGEDKLKRIEQQLA